MYYSKSEGVKLLKLFTVNDNEIEKKLIWKNVENAIFILNTKTKFWNNQQHAWLSSVELC